MVRWCERLPGSTRRSAGDGPAPGRAIAGSKEQCESPSSTCGRGGGSAPPVPPLPPPLPLSMVTAGDACRRQDGGRQGGGGGQRNWSIDQSERGVPAGLGRWSNGHACCQRLADWDREEGALGRREAPLGWVDGPTGIVIPGTGSAQVHHHQQGHRTPEKATWCSSSLAAGPAQRQICHSRNSAAVSQPYLG